MASTKIFSISFIFFYFTSLLCAVMCCVGWYFVCLQPDGADISFIHSLRLFVHLKNIVCVDREKYLYRIKFYILELNFIIFCA